MSNPAIKVEGLGKEYIIGGAEFMATTFREMLTDAFTAPFKRFSKLSGKANEAELFWALKDVSFDIQQGEVVGIIGRNGAGKSTLLKILCRITAPTRGRIELEGRVASLLEVGTGFHPELTGRENIYLNGAILGMKQSEIKRKFDEIVDFAEIEKFLDTPVKRYSSGMYVRLAFAVAANLEPEILLVDEVLAVGDIAFQKKCLGKMQDFSHKEGRTVLFVSHNMQAVKSLCSRAILLDKGSIVEDGATEKIINNYMSSITEDTYEITWDEDNAPGNNEIKLLAIRLLSNKKNENYFSSNLPITVEIEFIAYKPDPLMSIGFDLSNIDGTVIFRSYQTDMAESERPEIKNGKNKWQCKLPAQLFNVGTFYIAPRISIDKQYWIVNTDPVIKFEINVDHGVSHFWNTLVVGSRPGCIAPILSWKSST